MPCYLFLLHNPLSQGPPVPKKVLRCSPPKLSSSFYSHQLWDWFVFQECRFLLFLHFCAFVSHFSNCPWRCPRISRFLMRKLPKFCRTIQRATLILIRFPFISINFDPWRYNIYFINRVKDNVLDSRQPGHDNYWERVGSCNSPWRWYWVQVIRDAPLQTISSILK